MNVSISLMLNGLKIRKYYCMCGVEWVHEKKVCDLVTSTNKHYFLCLL